MEQRVLRVNVDSEDRAVYRHTWVESGSLTPGNAIEVELSDQQWIKCRIDRWVSDVLWVSRLDQASTRATLTGE